jgi:hypothetical protein
MDELYRHRPFTDSGSHPFHGTVPHIAYRKKTGNICLKQEWISVERPALGALPVWY